MKKYISASKSSAKCTGKTWREFIANLHAVSEFTVDSKNLLNPNHWITLYDEDGNEYEGEVTTYSDGTHELLFSNVDPVEIATAKDISDIANDPLLPLEHQVDLAIQAAEALTFSKYEFLANRGASFVTSLKEIQRRIRATRNYDYTKNY